MSDTMPERVWIAAPQHFDRVGAGNAPLSAWPGESEGYPHEPRICYVPEQRALDAERERDARRERKVGMEECEKREAALCAERDALQSDLKALLPLARLGLLAIDANSYFPVRAIEWGLIDWHRRDTANLTAARAILDREGV